MASALIVIDVQNYFINKHTKNLPKKISNHITRNRFDFVLFTKFINKKNSNFFKTLNWEKCTKSPDTDLHKTLSNFISGKNVFEKSTYSIFKSKKLLNFLKKSNITKLFLCGTDTDGCIMASAYDGFDSGYHIEILEDLCGSHYGNGMNASALKIIRKNLQS